MKQNNLKQPTLEIWWDKELELVRAWAAGVLDIKEAQAVLEMTEKMAESHGDNINWLIDLSRLKKATSKARRILAKATGHSSINKYAFVGASIFIRTVANFIASAAGQKNARHFATEEEALRWIREGK